MSSSENYPPGAPSASITNRTRPKRQRSFSTQNNELLTQKKTKKKCIPFFIQKTYAMINDCAQHHAGWTHGGNMFTIKNPTQFASEVIPGYFVHKKFASFERQLNYYGFRKIQTIAIKKADTDKRTLKHVTFSHDCFKQGREDLLCNIKRKTRGRGEDYNTQQQVHMLQTEVVSCKAESVQLRSRINWMERNMSILIQQLNQDRPGSDQNIIGNGHDSLPPNMPNPNPLPATPQPTLLRHPRIKSALPPGDTFLLPDPSPFMVRQLPFSRMYSNDSIITPELLKFLLDEDELKKNRYETGGNRDVNTASHTDPLQCRGITRGISTLSDLCDPGLP